MSAVRGVAFASFALAALLACTSSSTPHERKPIKLEPRPILPGAKAEMGIAYATASRSQTVDLYRSKKSEGLSPLVIRLNTGVEGTSAEALRDAGYTIAVVHYRPATEAPLLSAARDVKAAVRFLRANAGRLELDASQFIAWGNSDGGWLAMMLGLTGDQATVFDDPSLGNATTSSAVQVVIDWGGPTDFASLDADEKNHPSVACRQTYERHSGPGTPEAQWVCGDRQAALADVSCATAAREANLESYVATAKKFPSFLFVHGADDCVVSIWQPIRIYEALKKREETPSFRRMTRAGREDPRFELEETSRSLTFIHDTFHPDAGAKRD